jgi:hypothetical protein
MEKLLSFIGRSSRQGISFFFCFKFLKKFTPLKKHFYQNFVSFFMIKYAEESVHFQKARMLLLVDYF